MRFAIKTRPEHTTWARIRDAWQAADEISLFESAWNWDHFYPLTGDLTGPNLEAWTMLAALAQATRRIRLGCQVTGMIYRHPAVLANMAATGRHHLRRQAGTRPGRRLEPDGMRRLRHRRCRRCASASTASTRASRRSSACSARRRPRSNGQYVAAHRGALRAQAGAAAAPAGHHRRARPDPHAADRGPLGAAVERDRPGPAGLAQTWPGRSGRALRRDRPRPGRDHLLGQHPGRGRHAPSGSAAELAAAYRDAGVDLAIMNLPLTADPGILVPLAEALAPMVS